MCCAGSDRGSGRFRVSKKKIELQMGFWTKIDHSGRPPNTQCFTSQNNNPYFGPHPSSSHAPADATWRVGTCDLELGAKEGGKIPGPGDWPNRGWSTLENEYGIATQYTAAAGERED